MPGICKPFQDNANIALGEQPIIKQVYCIVKGNMAVSRCNRIFRIRV
jgi:hypothetical protein